MTHEQQQTAATSSREAKISIGQLAWCAWEEINLPELSHLSSSEIYTDEKNITLSFEVGEVEQDEAHSNVLPGFLKLEIRSLSDTIIDSISISKLTPESLGRILDAVLEYDRPHPRGVLPKSELIILSEAKLEHILKTAEEYGSQYHSSLGGRTEDIARRYLEKLQVCGDRAESGEHVLHPDDTIATQVIIRHGFKVSTSLGITKVLVDACLPSVVDHVLRRRTGQKVIWVLGSDKVAAYSHEDSHDLIYRVQNRELMSDARSRLALFSAVVRGFVGLDERVLCLTGSDESQQLNQISLQIPERVFPWLRNDSLKALHVFSAHPVLERVIEIALRFSVEGKEGHRIGACFVVGELGILDPYLSQNILNPFHGHPEDRRSIFSEDFFESLREYASNDGAVVIRADGIVERGGTYLSVPADRIELREGWGARHISAAALTSITQAAAVVISQSSGEVTVMWEGKPILKLSGNQSRMPAR